MVPAWPVKQRLIVVPRPHPTHVTVGPHAAIVEAACGSPFGGGDELGLITVIGVVVAFAGSVGVAPGRYPSILRFRPALAFLI